MENKNKKINFTYVFLFIFTLLLIICLVAFNLKAKKNVINLLNSDNNYMKLSSEKISTRYGFFTLNHKIKNLKIEFKNDISDYNLIIKNISIKNLIFGKSNEININSEVIIQYKDYENIANIKNGSAKISLKKGNVEKTDLKIEEISYKDIKNNNENIVINNFKINNIQILNNDYENMTLLLSIDRIIKKGDKEKNIKDIEGNIEFSMSLLAEKQNNKIISSKLIIDTINFSDITNNFAIDINGEMNQGTKTLSAETKITNYNSLVDALNNKDSEFLLSKDLLSNMVQIISLIPENEKNTLYDKYISIKTDYISKKILINNVDADKILQKLLFQDDKKNK